MLRGSDAGVRAGAQQQHPAHADSATAHTRQKSHRVSAATPLPEF